MTLYEYLQKESDERALMFTEFAKEIGVAHNTLYQTKRRKPSLTTYRKIANYLDIDVIELRKYPIKRDE